MALGLLTGKYDENHEFPKEDPRSQYPLLGNRHNRLEIKSLLETMRTIAEKHDATLPQVAINWLLKHDDVFSIPGAKNADQVEDNINTLKWKLTEDEWNELTNVSNTLDLDLFKDFDGS